ncbi:DEAD/DEAH box helicase [Alkalilimnicola ehrlichii MLHE-1]|uniref:ATP-dependent RNA helicase RhlB n=1 Tax=Alkalilimnicola ehrlichii (strain ATCC BAA-1101 / DSM 17681 / MLHE-1) TaxID=187272 RepID=Q0A6X5_ALKEH|nr:DEAD/DEAH box helicase [Alkalilimnicola ehrlichii]ABI57412.1 DEAD/DEAH box helicase domain protein [Alkalilimnicola ehrlichii MLHE-1]
MKNEHLSNTRFDTLGLHDALMDGIKRAGFEYCTPIQAATLPKALEGRDIAGQAQTGTGKSAAFLLAAMHRLMTVPVEEGKEGPWTLILAPTRELALQIHRDALQLGRYTGLKCAAIYGGTGYEAQRQQLQEGVDIIIGTPGRVIDFFKQRIFHLKHIEVVILDEADRMFDLGFIADIRYLMRRMPEPSKRMNMLFSATLSHRVMELAYEHLNDPEVVRIESEQITADKVRQKLYHVSKDEKIPLLLGLIRQEEAMNRSIIFVNTKRAADRVTGYLLGNDIEAAVISGDIPQKKRESLLKRFQDGELRFLVATDVAARGLHIEDVSHVINYDLPQDPEDYVHRIGRTARAGASGDAISFACEEYVFSLPDIESFIEQRIPAEMPSPEMMVEPKPPKRIQRSRPGGKGGRGRPGGAGNRRRSGNDRRGGNNGSNGSGGNN